MTQASPRFSANRRSLVFLLACALGLGLVLLVLAYAGGTPAVRAGAAPAHPGDAGLQVSRKSQMAPQAVDLEIGKEGPDEAYAGRVLTYTITITNHTGSTVNNVVVTDTWVLVDENDDPVNPKAMPATFNGNYWIIPPSPDFVSEFTYTLPTLDERTGVARWDLTPLGSGFNGKIKFTMTVPITQQPLHGTFYFNTVGPSTMGNSVSITGTGVTVNDPDQVVTVVAGPVFKLEKSEITEPGVGPRPGRLVTYALRLDNLVRQDSVPATGIVIWEVLPTDLIFESAESDAPGSTAFDPVSRHITWTLDPGFTLQVGQATTVTVVSRLATDQNWKHQIHNEKNMCKAISNELVKPVECWTKLTFETLGIFDKTYDTEPDYKRQPWNSFYEPLLANETYPSRTITYTIYVFNPLHQSVASNLRITDVMPPTWDYVDMVDGEIPQSVMGNTVVWQWPGVTLQPNGVMSFTFRAFIGPDTPAQGNPWCGAPYYNDLAASADEFPITYKYGKTFESHDGLAEVKVFNPVKLFKVVSDDDEGPTNQSIEQVAGELVTYTVTLENQGKYPVSNIRFTDTMPIDFRFDGMLQGDLPSYEVTRTLAWDIAGPLYSRERYTLTFQAIADGVWDALVPEQNHLNAYSPDTTFCPLSTAGVRVLSPIVLVKEADPPWESGDWVVQGEQFQYSVEYSNRSKSFDATIEEFSDELPIVKIEGVTVSDYDGFEGIGGRDPYTTTDGLPFILQTNEANSWLHTFTADTPGFGTGTDWCNLLSIDEDNFTDKFVNQKIVQEKGTVDLLISSSRYYGWVSNAGPVSPIWFKPHVDLFQTVHPKKVGLSGTVEVTLTLYNNMRNLNGGTERGVNGINVSYTLPNKFVFLEMVNGPAPSMPADDTLLWSGLNLPSGEGQRVDLRFRLEAPFEETGDFSPVKGYANASPADPLICIPNSEANYYVTKGVEVGKQPDPSKTGPFGVVEYTLDLINKTTAPVTGLVVTDTLPDGFEFIAVSDGYPEPYSTKPLVWRDLSIEASPILGGASKTVLRFRVRASGLFGTEYKNEVDGVSDGTYVTYTQNYVPDVYVEVVPGVALYKSVSPEQAELGQTLVYTLTVDNRSTKDVATVRITDTLPTGFTYQNMVAGSDPISTTPHLVWTLSRLDAGAKTAFVFRVLIGDSLATGDYCNEASATAYEADNPTAEVSIPDTDLTACVAVRGLPSFQRSKSVSPSSVRAGEPVTYTITLYNDSGESHTVRLTDTLPVSLTFAGVVGGTPVPALTSPVVWENLSLGVSETLTLTFQAQVDLYARSGTYYNRLDAATAEYKLPPRTGLAPLQVEEIPRYDLQVVKSDGKVRVDEGETLIYTIIYTNANEAALTLNNVVVTDTFGPPLYSSPEGLDPGWQQVGPDQYTYSIGDLGPGASGSITFAIRLSATIPSNVEVISNTVEIGHDTSELAFETDAGNNSSTDLDILHGADLLVMGVVVSPAQPEAEEPITFTVTVRNQGDESTNNVSGAGWFIVDLYLKGSGYEPSGPPGAVYSPAVFDHFGGYWFDYPNHNHERPEYYQIVAGLDGNDDEVTLQYSIVLTQADDYDLFVQVDTSFNVVGEPWGHDYGLVGEAIETNNIYSYGVVQVVDSGASIYLPLVLKNY